MTFIIGSKDYILVPMIMHTYMVDVYKFLSGAKDCKYIPNVRDYAYIPGGWLYILSSRPLPKIDNTHLIALHHVIYECCIKSEGSPKTPCDKI